jgi:hypothetical protein
MDEQPLEAWRDAANHFLEAEEGLEGTEPPRSLGAAAEEGTVLGTEADIDLELRAVDLLRREPTVSVSGAHMGGRQ